MIRRATPVFSRILSCCTVPSTVLTTLPNGSAAAAGSPGSLRRAAASPVVDRSVMPASRFLSREQGTSSAGGAERIRVMERDEINWEKMFRLLKEYNERYKEHPKLRNWVEKQREHCQKGKLDPERERRLTELGGFVFNVDEGPWEQNFGLLKEYKEAHGDCNVPQPYKENSKLGWWVREQRKLRKEGKLDPKREWRLTKLGFIWSTPIEAWEDMFNDGL